MFRRLSRQFLPNLVIRWLNLARCSERVEKATGGIAVHRCLRIVLLVGITQFPVSHSFSAQDHVLGSTNLTSVDEFQAASKGLNRDEMPGAALFKSNCLYCHNGSVPKAPHQQWLELMSPRNLHQALDEGIMAAQTKHLSQDQKQHIVSYLTFGVEQDNLPLLDAPRCSNSKIDFDTASLPPKNNWGHNTSRYADAASAGLSVDSIDKLRLKWAYAYPDANRARSQPAVGWGSVFVGSQDGTVLALDLDTGCERWRFEASAEVRTGIVLSDGADGQPKVFFGDILAKAYALDALTGQLIWRTRIDDHPSATLTGTPALSKGMLYVPVSSLEVIPAADPGYPCCTFRGKVVALNAQRGTEVWTAWAIDEAPTLQQTTEAGTAVYGPSGAPIWSSPLVDEKRGLIYVGTGENYSSPANTSSDAIHAFSLKDGKRKWSRQTLGKDAWNVACMMEGNPNCPDEHGPDMDFGASVILIEPEGDAGAVLVAGQKSGMVFGLDPDQDGKIIWSRRIGRGGIQGGVHFGMAAEGDRVYVPINDYGEAPVGANYAGPAQPGMNMLNGHTGATIWQHLQLDICPQERPYCDPGISAAVTAFPGHVVAGHLDGYVRIYSAKDGSVVWSFDTTRQVDTLSGLRSRGGSISGAGPVVHDGHLIVNSGYGLYFHEPGNLLLVFSAD